MKAKDGVKFTYGCWIEPQSTGPPLSDHALLDVPEFGVSQLRGVVPIYVGKDVHLEQK